MIKNILNNMLLSMQKKYNYDVRYLQDVLNSGVGTFFKYMGFQTMASHKKGLPLEILFAAKLRTILWDDCGPCTQLVVDLALESGVKPDIIRGIIEGNLADLPEEVALVTRFTEFVLSHHPEADDLREEILPRWGHDGLVTIGFAISSMRVYPALKYAMGYGKACQKVLIEDVSLAPTVNV